MFADLIGDRCKTIAYIISYDDPKYYNVLNEVPAITFHREIVPKIGHSGPRMLAILPKRAKDKLNYLFLSGIISYSEGTFFLIGFDDQSTTLRVDFKKRQRHNMRLLSESYNQGSAKNFPVIIPSTSGMIIKWTGMNDSTVSKADFYLSQLCVAHVRKTFASFNLFLQKDLFTFPMKDWVHPRWIPKNLFWLYVPAPRPPKLESWLKVLEANEKDFPWKDIGPAVEGFYLVSIELITATKGQLFFIDDEGEDVLKVTIQNGDNGGGTPLELKNFSNRARVSATLQLVLLEKQKGMRTSLSWGAHSDEQRLRLLPYTRADVRKFGCVRSNPMTEERLKEFDVDVSSWKEEVYEKITAEAEEVLSHAQFSSN